MKRVTAIGNVYEPEIDMSRGLEERPPTWRVRRIFSSLLGSFQNFQTIGKPRRSVDREQQQYSPLTE
jgi:hypothetical protein